MGITVYKYSTMKGRGTDWNPNNRFHRQHIEAVAEEGLDDCPPRKAETTVRKETARSIITRNQSPDVPFEQSMNPYRGCEHGCIYCFARPSHAWLDLSPGLDFETRLSAKTNAAALLRSALSKPGYQCRPIVLGTNTDPYQPIDREHGITRELLAVLLEARHPVHIITKGAHLPRDLELIAELASMNLASVSISLTTLRPALKRSLEPRAASPGRRLEIMRMLASAGVTVTALIAPVIPIITDAELEGLVGAAAEHGAASAGYVLLRLPHEVAALFQRWLQTHAPGEERRVMNRLREAHGGRDYDARFGHRMRGNSHWTKLLEQRFRLACRRHGLNGRDIRGLDCSQFRNPGASSPQLSLL